MSILDDIRPHLADLRKRLVISMIVLLVAFMVCFSFWEPIFALIKAPLSAAYASNIKGLLVQKAPAEGILTAMKVAFFAALIISMPVIFYQFWLFIAPGLYKNEKALVLPFVIFASIMFAIGVAFSYFIVFPFIIKYILAFGNSQFEAYISVGDYISFFTRFILGFGIAFELPVLSYFLAKVGLITDMTLRRFFKYAIVIIFVIAAIITPPDVISQLFLAVPLIGLYFLSIVIAYMVNREEPSKDGSRPDPDEGDGKIA